MNKFLTEIFEQPKSFGAVLSYYCSAEGEAKLNEIRELFRKEHLQQIIFTGMGSSYFASYAASCLFNNLGIHSYAVNTSELLYHNFSLVTKETLVVCISQSGESVEIVKLLKKLPRDVFFVGVSNEEKSSLSAAKGIRALLMTKAGREEMTSSKTYTSTALVLFILGWFLSDKWGGAKAAQVKDLIVDTERLLANHEKLVDDEFRLFGDVEFMQFIGRGPLFSSALQSELMFKEASKVPAAAAMGAEFRHGPMEMVKPGFKSILFAAEGNTYDQSIRMATDIAKNQGKVTLITNKDPHLSDHNIRTISINQTDEFLFAIESIIPIQLMVNHVALAKGYVPGDFILGGKITLKE